MPQVPLSLKTESFLGLFWERVFLFSGLASWRTDFNLSAIEPRSACFVNELKKRGIKTEALWGPWGHTGHFKVELGEKTVHFDSLPVVFSASLSALSAIDDKEKTKKWLKENSFPVAEGRAFWFWQKRKALDYGVKTLGFPVVVKPRSGSVSRHVTTGILNKNDLERAIKKAVKYEPSFIVERHIDNAFVYRATVIGFNDVFCAKQLPASVMGDGQSTVKELISIKNSDPRRNNPLFHKIETDEPMEKFLAERGRDFESVPAKDEIVFLRADSFMRLGGDFVEVTKEVHPDNLNLFRSAARLLNLPVTGIDFMINDISQSFKKSASAILELNTLPCLEIHNCPSVGEPQNAAGALADLFLKHYQ